VSCLYWDKTKAFIRWIANRPRNFQSTRIFAMEGNSANV